MSDAPAVLVERLSKSFHGASGGFQALNSVSLRVERGEMVALIGASGSGKSTLLRHLSGLIRTDGCSGDITVCGRTVLRAGRLARDIRSNRAHIGFVFQQFNLVDRLPVLTNVLAGMLSKTPLWRSLTRSFDRADERRGLEALARVGIAEHAYKRASQLSGGQQQRAAIARTLAQRADVILADEPIASLDPESARRVMQILATINREDRTTVIVSLHQVEVAMRFCPRTIALRAGRVVFDGPSKALTPAMLRELYGMDENELLGGTPLGSDAPLGLDPLPSPAYAAEHAVAHRVVSHPVTQQESIHAS